MKREVRRSDEIGSLSPLTPSGQPVISRIRMLSDPHNSREQYIETNTPDQDDAYRVLRFLDEMNGISWTPRLRKIEKELREALHDLAGAEK